MNFLIIHILLHSLIMCLIEYKCTDVKKKQTSAKDLSRREIDTSPSPLILEQKSYL